MSEKPLINIPELPPSVDKAVENLTNLPTKSIGQTLSDCWFLTFGGISQLAEKRRIKYAHDLETFKSELEKSIAKVPDENRIEPSTQIVLNALEQAKYCVEEKELRDMFVALLTSSIDSSKKVHPSFATILSQMSSIDAQMLRFFKKGHIYPICDLYHIVDSSGAFQVLNRNIFMSGPESISSNEQSISISSLIHLGILEIPFDQTVNPEVVYSRFKTTEPYIHALSKYTEKELDFHKGVVKLTPLGELFVSCCIPHSFRNIVQ